MGSVGWLSLKAAIFSRDRCMEAAEAATSANAEMFCLETWVAQGVLSLER